MGEEPTLTKTELTEALRKWDEEAAANNWPKRTDDARFADSADYLFELVGK